MLGNEDKKDLFTLRETQCVGRVVYMWHVSTEWDKGKKKG